MAADPGRPPLPFRLLAIGDRAQATASAIRTLAAAGGPAVALLLRDPDLADEPKIEWIAAALAICRPAGVRVLVHGSPSIALSTGADGVHLPEGSSVADARSLAASALMIGASRHDAAGVSEAGESGADYLTLSPVFSTPGKGEPLGLARFAELARSSSVPVVALGGITPTNAARCRAAGASAVAAIRAVWVGDVARNVRSLV